ncbi:NAD(P)-binding protein [Coemansia reversa NRRL 1564]|uniref:NAD(P)-binding protein n=1 Tax=Coemansia reversa (strain ATCC 12441 / NRRL 1564) TaxID=763665 RepID=A0A2G5B949_COERN|nr:NAD(P)-binding protein [Coemansia reversa NRRL 1564]|eukprot:PIA15553.1 NAD(P)-binding protein [Coemansia reversa NRRL 1564]
MSNVVVVTGASRSIGRQVCIELLQKQALTVIAVARSGDALISLKTEAEAASQRSGHQGQLITVTGDIASSATQDAVINTIRSSGGHLRALINNAATLSPTGPVLENTAEQWREVWETNFLAPVSLISRCLSFFRLHSGPRVILNITSSTSKGPVPGFGPYGSTKVALNYVTAAMATEYPDITSISFYPGVVETPMNESAMAAAKAIDKYAQETGNNAIDMRPVFAKLQNPIPSDLPSAIMANLALRADAQLSGKYFVYSDEEMLPYTK